MCVCNYTYVLIPHNYVWLEFEVSPSKLFRVERTLCRLACIKLLRMKLKVEPDFFIYLLFFLVY